jgi:hypothetical protein
MKHKALITDYFKELTETALKGDAREESFYPALARFVEDLARGLGKAEVAVTTLPKKTEAGNPDFRVWNGRDRIIGYIEAKPPSHDNLDLIESSEQLERYRHTFPNVILTNFCEFRLYRNGERVETVLAARPYIVQQFRKVPPIEKSDELVNLFEKFFSFSLPKSYTAESLAVELAKRTRFLRDVVAAELAEQQAREQGELLGFYEAFRKYLIAELSLEDFADLYAQTITYGLFAARTRAKGRFNRRAAFDNIPRTIGILRDVFRFISLGELPPQLEWVVDDISEVLAVADAGGILDRYYREGKGSDPIVHFYETFLAEYDPEERERRGVYYTPEPVVSYIVRSLHHLLKKIFARSEGLASEGVTLLDPAAGTMTFVARACQEAVREFESKYGAGGREEFIRKHILKNYYAFELMMAPYAVGHLKMSFFLEELGHRLSDDERFQFYLTNALETAELEKSQLPGMVSLSEESSKAGEVKRQRPILVILGNPPYSYESSNRGEWITSLIEDYKKLDDKPLGEKNPKGLQDDYVKFLRFAQWKIEQTGQGVVGMITNHSYLDNPTFRGMRASLMRTFDEIYLLDLHGNTLKRETCPDGSKDENVFDIRQGVAIAFFVRGGPKRNRTAKVYHADLWGLWQKKYDWLLKHDLACTRWQEIHPKPEFYIFVPRDEAAQEQYNAFTKVTDVFPVHSVGIVTARDNLTIHWTPDDAWTTVLNFSAMEPELARQGYKLGKDVRDWKVTLAQAELKESGPERRKIVPVLYRPFDVRYTYYTGKSRGFHCMPRPEVMRHMLVGENVALITNRQVAVGHMMHVLATKHVTDYHILETAHACAYTFPLYLYPDDSGGLFAKQDPGRRRPNVNRKIVATLAEADGRQRSPEEIFQYVYAVLYAPRYRQKYAEFLRIDFPRIPFSAHFKLFQAMAALGKRLVELHLLRSGELDPPFARFEGQGDNRVERGQKKGLRYDPKQKRVFINMTQYFHPVPLELWEYQIGGYQVLCKWLKDRQDRRLNLDEVKTYCRVVTAIHRTIAIQKDLDALYPKVEKEILEIK